MAFGSGVGVGVGDGDGDGRGVAVGVATSSSLTWNTLLSDTPLFELIAVAVSFTYPVLLVLTL